ncbi:HET-domain-containing protein, partial [Setomelanomma holmii]
MRGATFFHEPLDHSQQQIRLVSIQPASDGPIVCTVKLITLDRFRTPDYRALSYVWGPPTPTCKIQVNNQPFHVRQNLFDFLLAFRKRLHTFRGCDQYVDEVQWLWIDQICIAQAVVHERNHQVKMMSEIYTWATYVYIWLG